MKIVAITMDRIIAHNKWAKMKQGLLSTRKDLNTTVILSVFPILQYLRLPSILRTSRSSIILLVPTAHLPKITLLSDMLSDLTGDIYRQYSRLVGHTEAICSLAANSTGTLLASGGMCIRTLDIYTDAFEGLDGTFIWSVAKGTPLMIPPSTTVRGGTTALCWITGPNDRFEILAVGSSCGFILLWRQASDVCRKVNV